MSRARDLTPAARVERLVRKWREERAEKKNERRQRFAMRRANRPRKEPVT